MIFRIPSYPTAMPAPSLRGGTFRDKPIIPIFVIGPSGHLLGDVLVDTGADDIVLPLQWSARLGLSLLAAPVRSASTAAGTTAVLIRYATVIARLSDNQSSCRWRAIIGFAPLNTPYGIFGVAGGLEYFRTALDFSRREIEMTPLSSLPSTSDAIP